MALVRRPRRLTLADKLNLDDVDGSLDALDDLPEQEFDEYVLLYLRGDRQGSEVMRHPDNVERLYDSLTRLRDQYRRQYATAPDADKDRLGAMRRAIDIERRDVAPEAKRERDIRRQEQAVEVLVKVNARLERAARRQEELRARIDAAQRKSLSAQAADVLISRHQREFVAIKRELKDARDAGREAAGGQAPSNGGGAADPNGSTAPHLPRQAVR